MSIWLNSANNPDRLLKLYPGIDRFIMSGTEGEVTVEEARSGKLTLKAKDKTGRCFYLHSPSDPVKEAERLIARQGLQQGQKVALVGLGLGYHLAEILSQVGSDGQVIVFEPNASVLKAFLVLLPDEGIDLLLAPQVKLVTGLDLGEFVCELRLVLEHISTKGGKLIVHSPSLRLWPEEFEPIKQVIQEWKVKTGTSETGEMLMAENYKKNLPYITKDLPVNHFFGRLSGVPLVIISAGPSLDKNIGDLKKLKGKAVIMAVGTALGPLYKAGIKPDLIIVTDPSPVVMKQIKGILLDVPLIYLPTVFSDVVATHQGTRLVAFQTGYEESERCARELGLETVKTGGSVATTALDIAIRTGAEPIIFVGQDLAYTGNKTHASNTVYDRQRITPDNMLFIDGIRGEKVSTSISWLIFLKWIERRIAEEKGRIFVNATEGGALIRGTITMPLAEVIEKYIDSRVNVVELLQNLFGEGKDNK
ncbi:hypothetical protein Tfer_1247 [Thermincola ferriacetica]|uniref:6-hydroxymethylpterin diphosphokinase MptE-like domain-containing protein n=1 Tax=Thermincola ferriacetica TaxID=281456 RepID=A0A0L6W3R6_9FIRM|nr:6-hydroxymethylpterin diphosphokinase MptE-like protein [Thermincola ferriacetica]KNZ70106.1 hypothetical protein Tfer_1247 [Thermincola ferriacetica]